MTEEEFITMFSSCSEMVADQYYPKGEPGPRRSEYLRDQGVLAALLAEAFKHEGVIATLTDITAGSPIEVLRPHLTGHAFGVIRQCRIRGEGTLYPQTVGELIGIYRDGKLGEIVNLGPGRTREILTLLARTGLIDPPANLSRTRQTSPLQSPRPPQPPGGLLPQARRMRPPAMTSPAAARS